MTKPNADIYKKALEHSFDGIWIIDAHGNILFANDANERFYGFKGSHYIGKNVRDLLSDGTLKTSAALDAIRYHKQCTLRSAHDDRHIYLTSIPVFNEAGEVEIVITNTRDAEEIVAVEKEGGGFCDGATPPEPVRLRIGGSDEEKEIAVYSKKGRELFEMIRKVAQYATNVLIVGESGTGKEVAARLMHALSPRKNGPFVGVNCGAIPDTLLESELFGHEAGAFTGAKTSKPGIFELAAGGTLLLDEIAEIPLSTQVKLLRVIQEKQFMRLGGVRTLPVDARILGATNKDLDRLSSEGKFRRDLYYRLNVITITVPPLRDRREDIRHLIFNFLDALNKKHGTSKFITPRALQALIDHNWPGNVRELENAVERSYILSDTFIDMGSLPVEFHRPPDGNAPECLKSMVRAYEAGIIRSALRETGAIKDAAAALGIDHSTLWRKMRRLGIRIPPD